MKIHGRDARATLLKSEALGNSIPLHVGRGCPTMRTSAGTIGVVQRFPAAFFFEIEISAELLFLPSVDSS